MNAAIDLKQLVPSHVCLKCDGCCRYDLPDSHWRPKWDKKEFVDDNNYVTAIQDCGQNLCRFLNKLDNTCLVYQDRPFECKLYPFVLSKTGDTVDVFVHLACPYIQDHQTDPAVDEYMNYLKKFFQKSETLDFLKRNQHLMSDYSHVLIELKHVLTLQTAF